MFQFIRKHQAMGLIFIGIVIVSFVIFFSPNQSFDRNGQPGGAVGTIGGKPVSREALREALREVRLVRALREGSFRDRGTEEQREALDRLLLQNQAEELGIVVPDEVAAARILEMDMFKDEKTGAFNRAAYDQFLTTIEREQGYTRTEFERFMRNDAALQHLVQLGGLSGSLVTPREAEARYRAENSQYSAQVVVISGSNYVSQVDLSPANVAQFYTNRMADFRIPERVQVRYVRFAVTNFLEDANQKLSANTNLNQLLDAAYQQRGPEAFRDLQGNLMTAEAAKAQMLEQERRRLALESARPKANEFANRLYQMDASADSLSKLAAELGMTVQTSAPFDQFRPPADLRVPSTFNRVAFGLSTEEPFATPLVGEDGVYVFAFHARVPSVIQPLEDVLPRVTDLMRRTETRSLAEAAGNRFSAAATAALAQSKTFEAAAAEAGFTAITLTNLSRSTMALPELGPRLTVSEILRVAGELSPGKVSTFQPGADGGFVLFLQSRNPVPDEQLKRELPEYLKQVRQFGRFAAFSEWQRKRVALADVRIPGFGGTNDVSSASN